ncbi:MAG: inorganic phosphate transporter [Bacteroidales bacterium]|nr:inorganic phosphate transporter [Lentimicrobiaceae bacterium]MDD5696295.1 inorganic phosphate transporter [Bacteroidales bacterium]
MLLLVFISSGLFLGWSLGANDAANVFGSAVGSRMLSFRRAAIIASIFVTIGAVFQGKGGADTLNELGTVDALGGSFTVTLCAAFTVFVMTKRSLPVSTSQAIVGAIIGWSLFTDHSTDLSILRKIFLTWITGPVLGMLFAAGLYLLLRWALRKAKIHVIKLDSYIRTGLILVGAFGAYSLGANNIANVMGVFVSSAPNIILDFGIFQLDGVQLLFLLGGIAISVGIFTYGQRVMKTVGNDILSLNPEAAIVVVLAQALVLFLFSSSSFSEIVARIGLPPLPLVPVSSTQVVIGAVLGIGLVKGVREIKLKALGGVALGWIGTPVIAGLLTFFLLFFMQNVFDLQVTKGTPAPDDILLTPLPAKTIDLVVYGSLILLALIILFLILVVFRQQKLRWKTTNELLVQQNQNYLVRQSLHDMEIQSIHRQKDELHTRLENKRKEFMDIALNLTEQRTFLESILGELEQIRKVTDKQENEQRFIQLAARIRQRMSFSSEKANFYSQVEQIHKDFHMKLTTMFPHLTQQEKHLAMLIQLNLSTKEMATLLNISPKSAEVARYRLKKKLNLKHDDDLFQFIHDL